MPFGYQGRILHVDLTAGKLEVEEPEDAFYRKLMGGSAMGAHYLLKHTPASADPLGPDNTLCLMVGVTTGAPVSGQARVCATAKSPETGLVGDSQSGGFWPVELKRAGFDGIVIRGRSPTPVYLWLHDGQAELRDADHLWGQYAAAVEDAIREELGDARIQVLQCGPAAEQGVRYGALISNSNRANGRTGMGTVAASKNLRAVAVRGRARIEMADPETVRELAKWGGDNFEDSDVYGLGLMGTAEVLLPHDKKGDLPTHNWRSGTFEHAEDIGGPVMTDTILKEKDTCFACVVRCKRVVEIADGPYPVDPRYGGPEYETLATMGSYCGVSDLAAVCRANQLCNMCGMDTIACGATIAWAMDCFEQGLLTTEDTGGIELRFGDAAALVEMVELIGRREGFGRILGEGSARAARTLGVGEGLVVAVKNHELPAHMPQVKRSLALIYAVNPFGADHQSHELDPSIEPEKDWEYYHDRLAELDLRDPQPLYSLGPGKVRYALYTQYFYGFMDSACFCQFVWGPAWQLYGPSQLVQVVQAITGWDFSMWELMKAGERRLNLLRAFNARDGVGSEADTLPRKLFVPLEGGASDGLAVAAAEVEAAIPLYYSMAGWDETGRPTRAKLTELSLEWVADELGL
jgi:aldehyde:ferredoxin oxidoreductase